MASYRTTINKTVTGAKRMHYGTMTLVNATTSGTVETDLRSVEGFFCGGELSAWSASAGVVTCTHINPGASAGVVGWMAVGY